MTRSKSSALRLLDLPEYAPFVERYVMDLPRFAAEVCGRPATWQQLLFYDSVQGVGSRTSVSSGHGCFAPGTLVQRANGCAVAVEDVRPGDWLMGPDGASSRPVFEVVRGRETMHRVTYSNGSFHEVNESHVLCVASDDGAQDGRHDRALITVREWLTLTDAQRADLFCYRLLARATNGTEAEYTALRIASVAPLGVGDYYGFELGGDGRFLAADGTVLRNTGKTDAAAIVLLWHLTCYRYSNTILSGPKLEVVLSGVRKYVADHVERMNEGPFAWLAQQITVARKSIYIKGYQSQWWATAKTAPAGKPEAMAGEHRKYLLWLIDEASGVDDAVMGIILGSLTEDWNRIALMSQPTRAGGFFYDTHHAMSSHRGGVWASIRMSSEESPLVNDSSIVEKLLQYGGREDPQYKIKVRGDFPDKLDGQLLSRPELESCIGRPNVIPAGAPWGWLVLVDVAAGEYRDKSVITLAKVYGSGASHEREPRRMHITKFPVVSNSIQPRELIGRVMEEARMLSNATVAIDCGGLGLVVYKSLVDAGLPNVVKVLWGRDCWRKELAEQYASQRSQAMVCAAKAARAGQLSISADAFPDTKIRIEFLDQHRVPYRFDDKARYRIESKGSAEWEGIPSPDILDSVSFGFLEGVIPTVSDAALDGGAPVEQLADTLESALLAAIG